MAPIASYIGALTLGLLCSSVLGKEINVLGVAESEEYSSGAKHEQIMKLKLVRAPFNKIQDACGIRN